MPKIFFTYIFAIKKKSQEVDNLAAISMKLGIIGEMRNEWSSPTFRLVQICMK